MGLLPQRIRDNAAYYEVWTRILLSVSAVACQCTYTRADRVAFGGAPILEPQNYPDELLLNALQVLPNVVCKIPAMISPNWELHALNSVEVA